MKSVFFARTALRIMVLGFVLAGMIGLGTNRNVSPLRHNSPGVSVGQRLADSNGQETHGKNDPKGPSGKRSSSPS